MGFFYSKLDRRLTQEGSTRATSKNSSKTQGCEIQTVKADTLKKTLPATPPVSDIYFVFLCDAFEKFWLMYPIKQSKAKAWEIFQALTPTPELFQCLLEALKKQCEHYNRAMAKGHWMPHWKHARVSGTE
ncbi:MAG: hypothetical protein A3F13_02260 [Gammaproteobacteria bacterium RIFCSPHIGHO2_12_FULL_40_19]|nr:MAG: hypothetical protein A3F13_02260 [Gammaproteobacteria bacterium RIFCSPHIGHO2_12_FULL_40_19]